MDICQKVSDNLSLLTSERVREVNVSSSSPTPFLGEATSSSFSYPFNEEPIKLSMKEKLLTNLHMHYNHYSPLMILLGGVLGMASEAPHPHSKCSMLLTHPSDSRPHNLPSGNTEWIEVSKDGCIPLLAQVLSGG